MRTREYLGQLRNIERKINDKIEEAVRWYNEAMSIGAISGSEDRVQTSKRYDKMGDAMSYYLDCSNEANDLAYEMAKKKKTILKQIDGMEEPIYYTILKDYYYNNKPLSNIAVDEKYSKSQISRLLVKAIDRFEDKYGESYL